MSKNNKLVIFSGVLLLLLILIANTNLLSVEASNFKKIYRVGIIDFKNLSKDSKFDYLSKTIPINITSFLFETSQLYFLDSDKLYQKFNEIQNNLQDSEKGDTDKILSRLVSEVPADVLIFGNFEIDNSNSIGIKAVVYYTKDNKKNLLEEKGDFNKNFYEVINGLVNKISINFEKEIGVENVMNKCRGLLRSLLILIDASSSMNDKGKIDLAKEAAKASLDKVRANTEVAILTFAGTCDTNPTKVVHPFSTNINSLKASIDSVVANGKTPLTRAVKEAIEYLKTNHRGRIGHIILLCDGQDDCKNMPETLNSIKIEEIEIVFDTIGFDIKDGSQADKDLTLISEHFQGSYQKVNGKEELSKTFNKSVEKDLAIDKKIMFLGY